jgi:hypothetical protein
MEFLKLREASMPRVLLARSHATIKDAVDSSLTALQQRLGHRSFSMAFLSFHIFVRTAYHTHQGAVIANMAQIQFVKRQKWRLSDAIPDIMACTMRSCRLAPREFSNDMNNTH